METFLFMPQSQMPYGDRTAAVRCQIYKIVRPPYGHRSFFTHCTMPLEVLTRSSNFSRHRTMFQPQTASYGRRTVAAGLSLQTKIRGHRTVAVRSPHDLGTVILTSYGDRTVAVQWPYERRRIILVKHKGIVRSPYGHRTVTVLAMQNNPRKMQGASYGPHTICDCYKRLPQTPTMSPIFRNPP